ncbi:ABC transporter permease [Streptomyces hebeiensis]|uniref:Transport permease protein n=1 Tax=Streptomyces hebeiensis TaxID=229486 RepID=A0ABN1UXP4_9ACTN
MSTGAVVTGDTERRAGDGPGGRPSGPGGPGRGADTDAATPRTSTPSGRLAALGRAEFTLLLRNKTALFSALFVPVVTIAGSKVSLDRIDLGKSGLSMVEAALIGGLGTVLIMAVYSNLAAAYTARREDLVLKRLRTGEATDAEILTGTALPAATVTLVQCALLVAASSLFLDVSAPRRPELLIAGLLIGTVLLAALAAATSAVTRTVESAQITIMPLFLISVLGSGLFVPLDVLPEKVASVCELLPLSGVMTLIRAGWVGGIEAYDVLGAALTALAWTVLGVFAVRRWFRWEPRR